MDRGELEGLDRESLVVRAQAAGIRRARILTRPELIDELLRLDPSADEARLRKSRGFFGRARDLVARVVERGLHLPDAADRIRTLGGPLPSSVPRVEPQAMPTVTLAEIYAAQGHSRRAIETLRRVLAREPEHAAARALLARLEDAAYVAPPPPLPPEPEVEPALNEPESEPSLARASESEPALEPATTASSPPFGEDDVDVHADTAVFDRIAEVEPADECVAIPLGAGRTYVRWTVSVAAIAAQQTERPQGRFVVRAHVVMPSWDGPTTDLRDLSVSLDDAEATLQGLPEPSVVRVAVGWLDGEAFVPLAHSPALELAQGRRLVVWTTTGTAAVALGDPRSAAITRAVNASRRLATAPSR